MRLFGSGFEPSSILYMSESFLAVGTERELGGDNKVVFRLTEGWVLAKTRYEGPYVTVSVI